MPSKQLSRRVEARKLAEKSATLSGLIEPANLPRVLEAVLTLDAAIQVNIVFAFSGNGKPTVRINVSGEVKMACQRCLDDVAIALELDNELTVVAHDDEAKSVQGLLEPIVLEDGLLDIYALVEDEILLSLPIVSKHDDSNRQCQEFVGVANTFNASNAAGENKLDLNGGVENKVVRRSQTGEPNPFDRLKDLQVNTGPE